MDCYKRRVEFFRSNFFSKVNTKKGIEMGRNGCKIAYKKDNE